MTFANSGPQCLVIHFPQSRSPPKHVNIVSDWFRFLTRPISKRVDFVIRFVPQLIKKRPDFPVVCNPTGLTKRFEFLVRAWLFLVGLDFSHDRLKHVLIL